jgi:hypothetical protein
LDDFHRTCHFEIHAKEDAVVPAHDFIITPDLPIDRALEKQLPIATEAESQDE